MSDGPVNLNGIDDRAGPGRPLSIDPTTQEISMQRIQLRVGDVVLFQGKFTLQGPGRRPGHAGPDLLDRTSGIDGAQDDSEARARPRRATTAPRSAGSTLNGEAKLELVEGGKPLTGTIELPKVFTDAEGNGLTGSVQLKSRQRATACT